MGAGRDLAAMRAEMAAGQFVGRDDAAAFLDARHLFELGGIDALYLTVGKIRITDEGDARNNDVIEVGVKEELGRNLKTEADVAFWFSSVMFRIAARELSNPKTGEERQRKIKRLFGWKF